MREENKRHARRVKNLVMICSLIAVVLSVSTYAWFIGMQTVKVTSFEIEIAATDSLLLSLDGEDFKPTVTISKDTYNDDTEEDGNQAYVYEGHSNSWGGKGLIPISSIGEMDSESSRMKLYEKASLTATPGGYRLMASRIDNSDDEQDGYVVFDLFIRNFTGAQYIGNPNKDDEEAIYLTTDSEVTIPSGGVKDTGIENSVRVAFAQIGRVSGDRINDTEIITGITCASTFTDDTEPEYIVTGLCRAATIWEPNDRSHVQNAINWYETSCLKRTGSNVRDAASYNGDCNTVVDGLPYPTYAVKQPISSNNNVNIYDGTAYNTYPNSGSFLAEHPYFTDSDKYLTGTSRPEFMSLAPNSITKIRVYIWIEGQDVDNYDFAAIGKTISVKFGFTKQRFTEDDVDYSGSSIDVNQGLGPNGGEDLTAPIIKLVGDQQMEITVGGSYDEPGATAIDNIDGTIDPENIKILGTVNTSHPGEYRVLYRVEDAAKNVGHKVRIVRVVAAGSGSGED